MYILSRKIHPHAGVVDALKWSSGHKTYIEKTLLGINVNNCNILGFALRIVSTSCFVFSINFSWVISPPVAAVTSARSSLPFHFNSDPMMDLSLDRNDFFCPVFWWLLTTDVGIFGFEKLERKINAKHFLIVIVTNKQHGFGFIAASFGTAEFHFELLIWRQQQKRKFFHSPFIFLRSWIEWSGENKSREINTWELVAICTCSCRLVGGVGGEYALSLLSV